MYQLQTETEKTRTYRSTVTGTEISTQLIHTDKDGGKWWAFVDMMQIPHIRKMAANSISQLYGQGFTKEDLTEFINRVKPLLKSSDPEKYEKMYSEVLTLESITESNLDPVKQELGLCAVYILSDTERVDTFSTREALDKMALWAIDLDTQAFFLNWLSDGINDFRTTLEAVTQIASMKQK